MFRFFNPITISFLVVSLSMFSCSSQEDIPIADFDVSRIVGEYSVDLNIEYAGPRPAVSVFNGYLEVEMTGSDSFTLTVDFPGDYISEVFSGTVREKIVSSTNSTIGGVYFDIQETSEFKGNPEQFSVKTLTGETKSVYALFIEKAGNEIEMNLNLIEKTQTPSTFEFTATK